MKNDKLSLLLEAHALLECVTPLKYDCGVLCGNACCKEHPVNGESCGGMLLLPAEEDLLYGKAGFEIKDTSDGSILLCKGICDRSYRPFMCRIFPFYARIDKETERISLRIDPRAANVCPIALKKKGTRHSVFFHRNAVRAIRLLMRDEDFRREIIKTSEFCDGLYEFYRTLIK